MPIGYEVARRKSPQALC